MENIPKLIKLVHCVKSVCFWSFSGPYFPVFRPNARKYGLEKLRIRILFTQWFPIEFILIWLIIILKGFGNLIWCGKNLGLPLPLCWKVPSSLVKNVSRLLYARLFLSYLEDSRFFFFPLLWDCKGSMDYLMTKNYLSISTQLIFTCSKFAIETLKKGLKYVQS